MLDLIRYILAGVENKTLAQEKAEQLLQQLHGLLPEGYYPDSNLISPCNESNGEMFRFNSVFNGDEIFLRDHIIDSNKTLPGVVFLEMVRSALEQVTELRSVANPCILLSNIVWSTPLICQGQAVATCTELEMLRDGGAKFSISTTEENTGPHRYNERQGSPDKVIHCQGKAKLTSQVTPNRIDLTRLITTNFSREVCGRDIYKTFEKMGVDYGPSHRVIQHCLVSEECVLAKLESLTSANDAHSEALFLPPGLLDATLQTTLVSYLGSDLDQPPSQPILPFSLDRLEIYRPLQTDMWVIVRNIQSASANDSASQGERYDIDLCDLDGNLCLRLNGFYARKLASQKPTPQSPSKFTSLTLYEPLWEAQACVSHDENSFAEHLLIVCDDIFGGTYQPNIAPYLETQLVGSQIYTYSLSSPSPDDNFVNLFNYVLQAIKQAFLRSPDGSKLLQLIAPTAHSADQPTFYSGLVGLLNTAGLENPSFHGQLIQIDQSINDNNVDLLWEIIQENMSAKDCTLIAYSEGLRATRQWRTFPCPSESVQHAYPWKDGGIYVITGGTGGLGLCFAHEIARHCARASLILVGRKKAPSDSAQQSIQVLKDLGCNVEYCCTDVADADAVNVLMRDLEARYGGINGILHAAGVNGDSLIVNKTDSESSLVMSPKVTGLMNLDASTATLQLDFFVVFSSISGVLGNAGQSDYAAANAFMDSFSANRNAQVNNNLRSGKTLSINWPLWRLDGVGMGLDRGYPSRVKEKYGLIPIDVATGVEAFYQAYASGREQVLVVYGYAGKFESIFSTPRAIETRDRSFADRVKSTDVYIVDVDAVRDYVQIIINEATKIPRDKLKPNIPFSNFGIDSIAQVKIIERFECQTGELPKTLLFEFDTIAQLSDYFLKEYSEQLAVYLQNNDAAAANSVNEESTANVPQSDPSALVATQTKALTSRTDTKIEALSRGNLSTSRSVESSNCRDIAIIGISGRYPNSNNLSELWENLKNGNSCISAVEAGYWAEGPFGYAGQQCSQEIFHGGFLSNRERFDRKLFNIDQSTEELLSPEVKLTLETVWEAFEDAGYSKRLINHYQKRSSGIGVYIGCMYGQNLLRMPTVKQAAFASNSTDWQIANRVSHFFNLTGPSMAINSACSSALVAINTACESLFSGACTMVLAGGVNLTLDPSKYEVLRELGILEDGLRSMSFGRGQGYVPGEGVGLLLLKPYDLAVSDNDQIHAVIKASAVNHSGGRQMYSVPDPNQQSQLIDQIFTRSGIDPRTISYVESAANGSPLGDAIEFNCLSKYFQKYSNKVGKYALGSVKSNLGHLEAASGISQVSKVILQMQKSTLVPSINSMPSNTNIDLESSPFFVNQETRPWKKIKDEETGVVTPRRSLINSIGAGGTYSALIIEEAPQDDEVTTSNFLTNKQCAPFLFAFSAASEYSLLGYLALLRDLLLLDPAINAVNLEYSLACINHDLDYRIAVIAESTDALLSRLSDVLADSLGDEINVPKSGVYISSNLKSDSNDIVGNSGRQEISQQQDRALRWVNGSSDVLHDLAELSKVARKVTLPNYVFDYEPDRHNRERLLELLEQVYMGELNEDEAYLLMEAEIN